MPVNEVIAVVFHLGWQLADISIAHDWTPLGHHLQGLFCLWFPIKRIRMCGKSHCDLRSRKYELTLTPEGNIRLSVRSTDAWRAPTARGSYERRKLHAKALWPVCAAPRPSGTSTALSGAGYPFGTLISVSTQFISIPPTDLSKICSWAAADPLRPACNYHQMSNEK